MIQDCKKIDKELPLERSVLKTYIVQFIYPNGNGWAFINATSVSQAQSIFYNQTRFQDTKITGVKETKWYGNNIQLVFEGSVTTAQLVNVTISLSDIINNSDNYDSVEEYIRSVINLDNYYTKEETDAAIDKAIKDMELPEIDLSEYVKTEDLPEAIQEEIRKLNITSGNDGITPHIDPVTKHWMIGDEDTGILAIGQNGDDGDDGITPHIHPTSKHWMIGDTDTGILAEGKSGTPGKSAYEIYCEHTTNPVSEEEWIESLGGGTVTGSSNYRKLEGCFYYEGDNKIEYDEIFASNLTFATHKTDSELNRLYSITGPGDTERQNAAKQYISRFESLNSTSISIAERTRKFIQEAINSTREDEILIFPYKKVFYVTVDWKSPTAYSYLDKTYDFSSHHYMPEVTSAMTGYGNWSVYKFYCLNIRKRIHIDLNGSTIKIIPSWHTHCKIFNVSAGQFLGGWRDTNGRVKEDITDPAGTIIENGVIDGNYDNLIKFRDNYFGWYSNREYHFHGIDATCTIELKNLIFQNIAGDGATISSNYRWNGDAPLPFTTTDEQQETTTINKGCIMQDGSINSGITYNGYVYSNFASIERYTPNVPDGKIVLRPYYANKDMFSMIDNTSYWVSEYITVAYYNSSKQYIANSIEVIQFGDTLSPPDGAVYFRVSAKRDPSMDSELNVANSKLLQLYVCEINKSYGSKIINCVSHHCGRDGLTLAQITNGEISDCYIYGCEQASIDIENTVYLDWGFKLKNLRVDSILNTTGHDFTIENSRIGYLRITNPNTTLINCDIDDLISVSPTEGTFNHNISQPRRIAKNCIIRNNLYSSYTIFENCVIGGDKLNNAVNYLNAFIPDCTNPDSISKNGIRTYPDTTNREYGNYKNIFNGCVVKTSLLGPNIYNDCIIQPTLVCALIPYIWGTYYQNTFTFNRCRIETPYIECMDYTWSDHAYKQLGACLDIYNCNIYLTGHATKSTTIDGQENPGGKIDTSGSNFLGCCLHNLIDSEITFSPNDAGKYDFTFMPYQNTRIENNVFVTSNSTPISQLRLIEFDLHNVYTNDAFRITIRNNIIRHKVSTASGLVPKTLNLIKVDTKDFISTDDTNKVRVFIEDNRYRPTQVVKNVPTMAGLLQIESGIKNYTSPTTYNHTYKKYLNTNKIERDIIYYAIDAAKYYKLVETLYPRTIVVNGKNITLDEDKLIQDIQVAEVTGSSIPIKAVVQEYTVVGDNPSSVIVVTDFNQLIKAETVNGLLEPIPVYDNFNMIIRVSTLPSSDIDTDKIYYNTSDGKYYQYVDNQWEEIA